MTDSQRLATESRTALVTGASGGIGAAIARRLARDGHHVVVSYRSGRERAAGVLASIEAHGGSGELLLLDVQDHETTTRTLTELSERRTVGVLVHAAGVVKDAILPNLSWEDWQTVTRTSLDGFFNLTKPLVLPMVQERFGRIIAISSLSGLIGNPGQVGYSAAKAGLIGAVRSLALEVAKKKVTVNAVAPGLIDTDLVTPETRERMEKLIPLRRLGTPEEVAALVGFLASDEAAYITGQTISISGGL